MEKRIVLALCATCFGVTLWAGQTPPPVGPSDSASAALTPRSEISSPLKIKKTPNSVHRVKEGDTLYKISRASGTSVQELKSMNHLQSDRLRVGQRLLIVSPDTSPGFAGRGPNQPPQETRKSVRDLSKPADSSHIEGLESVGPTEIAIRSMDTLISDALQPGNGEEAEISLRDQLVIAGLDFLGVPYRWRGMSERRGVDCSGLVKSLFDKFQIELPHSAREQFKLGEKVARAELAVGDLVFFSTRGKIPTHVGIYIGDNRFIHAAHTAGHVIVSSLSQRWYQKNFVGARRISDLWKDEPKPSEAKGN
jgi:peptidoglycan DL-endopeptidase LytE